MQCPSCQKEVSVQDKDVGALFTCPQCRSVYFINFDGTPEYSDIDQPSAEELEKLQNQLVPEKKKQKKKSKSDEIEAEVEVNAEAEETEDQSPDFELEVPAIEMALVDTTPFEALPTESVSIENISYLEVQEASAQDFSSIASEIETFGNQNTVVAGISYDLEISGLDTKQSQELLREAIDDSRFGWHPEDIVREIRTGTCHLKNLTPVQAFVIARRIQFIDVQMKWKQHVLA